MGFERKFFPDLPEGFCFREYFYFSEAGGVNRHPEVAHKK